MQENIVRKAWIDSLRGICMIAILLDHTEIYYTGGNIINYNFYVVNALTIFFFLSGYLFYKETTSSDSNKELRRKLTSICRSIIMPYFIFTTAMAVPKAIVHNNDVREIFLSIITGNASWFIAALAVAETAFAIALWITRKNHLIMSALSFLLFAVCIILSMRSEKLYWQIDNACMAFPILYAGFVYHKKEEYINKVVGGWKITVLLLIIVITLKAIEHHNNVNLLIEPIRITNFGVFTADVILVTLLMVNIAKALPRNKIIEWTGSHSIVYYFLCGGVPLIVAKSMNKAGITYNGNYLLVILALLMVYVVATLLTWIIYRYIPFVTGRKCRT